VAGPPRVKFLHNLLSNDIAGLATGHSRLAALMNLKGQQVAWMRVMAEADTLICELPIGVRDTVVDTFVHYKVGAPVRFEKPETLVFGLLGPKAQAALPALGFSGFRGDAETFQTAEGFGGLLRVNRSLDIPAGGFTLHAEPAAAASLEEQLRSLWGEPVSADTLETLRVEEGIPWHGIDVVEENLLHETGQLALYHSSSKGCYLGQEVVARLEGRGGHVNKRLRGLKCSRPSTAGDDIVAEEKRVGGVTSAGLSPRSGAIALGYLHRSYAEAGTRVLVAGAEAEVTTLPFEF
jgi:folate-binding protein YgfZ